MRPCNFFTFLAFLAFTVSFQVGQAQRHAYNWYFGYQAGLRFDENSVSVLTDGRNAHSYIEACSSISDANRNLLFYSNGHDVYNRNHEQMPNGFEIRGVVPFEAPISVIVPSPAGNGIYYIFSCDRYAPSQLKYSIVDLSLEGGLGDVTEKNVTLHTSVVGSISASVHANGIDFWIIVHELGTDRFLSYLVTAAGIAATPVVSAAGSIHTDNPPRQIKVSPDKSKIAITFQKEDYISTSLEVFKFNPVTGKIGSLIFAISTGQPGVITSLRNLTGIEFSPNSNLIYVTNVDSSGSNHIYQFNLSSGDMNTILTSIYIVGTPLHGLEYCMQMGPDGKIYIVYGGGHGWGHVSRINEPNGRGDHCNYVEGDIYLEGKEAILYLPIFIQGDFVEPPAISTGALCIRDTIEFEATALGPYDSCVWDFDDPASGENNKAFGGSARHAFTHAGTFNVKVTTYLDDAVVTMVEQQIDLSPLPDIDLGPDRILCEGDFINLSVEDGYSYKWSTGADVSSIDVDEPGWYTVEVSNGQCQVRDSVYVDVLEMPVLDFPAEMSTCAFPVTLDAGNPGYTWEWNTGQVTRQIQVSSIGSYAVKVSNGMCTVSDTVAIKFVGLIDLAATADNPVVDYDETVLFTATGTDVDSWYWEFGDGQTSSLQQPRHFFGIAGDYMVLLKAVNRKGCENSASIPITVMEHLFVPNVFTPGNDDKNERFVVEYNGSDIYQLRIFNRWGKQIFSSSDKDVSWGGGEAPTGVYFYQLTIGPRHYRGSVQLLR